jgi:hypothetical protein
LDDEIDAHPPNTGASGVDREARQSGRVIPRGREENLVRGQLRGAAVLIGSLVLGFALGGVLDKAGVSPNNDGDMLGGGLLAGLGLVLILIGFVRDP